jgi:phosphoglycerate dehydrogenase-like enzyme
MIKVLTTGRLGKEFRDVIGKDAEQIEVTFTDEPANADIANVDCLACFSVPDKIDISGIKWIHLFGAGVDSFLRRDDFNPETILTRTVGRLGLRMGEFCLCHILNFFQNTFRLYENKKVKKWETDYPVSLKGKTVLILGTGAMAKGISQVLHPLQTEVIGVNTSGMKTDNVFSTCLKFADVKSVASRVSCIVNTLPLSHHTERLLDKRFFGLFHRALFINVGRGKSVVTGDLISSMESSNLAYAVLDVFDDEPLPVGSPLWEHPDIFISPHQSALTDIQDIVESFYEAYRLMQYDKRNYLFVDVNRGY